MPLLCVCHCVHLVACMWVGGWEGAHAHFSDGSHSCLYSVCHCAFGCMYVCMLACVSVCVVACYVCDCMSVCMRA